MQFKLLQRSKNNSCESRWKLRQFKVSKVHGAMQMTRNSSRVGPLLYYFTIRAQKVN